MLQAYFDGSGEHTSTDFVCMAGYVADDMHWDSFCQDWCSLLQKHGIGELHMREFNQTADRGTPTFAKRSLDLPAASR
jgi:hypothetical protein